MWKPRNKWQLQTKGGCESSGGGSSSKPMVINYDDSDEDIYLEAGLTTSDFIGATIVGGGKWVSVIRAYVVPKQVAVIALFTADGALKNTEYRYNAVNGRFTIASPS